MSVANIIYDEEQRYLDARYDLICNIIKEFFDWYDRACTPDNDCINAFVCEQSKEIDDIIETFNKEL